MAGVAPVAQGITSSAPTRTISGRASPTSSVSAGVLRCARLYGNKGKRGQDGIRAVSETDECNEEECAPTKEVGKVSLEWVAEDKTKVVGTYPPLARRTRAYTGYVEKDTAGQTNIYAVEPTVYISESVLSSGSAGSTAEGSDVSLAVSFGLGLIAVAAASSVLLNIGKNAPAPETTYAGPPLSFYIQKFTPAVVDAVAPSLEAPELELVVEEAAPTAFITETTLDTPVTVERPSSLDEPAAAAEDEPAAVAEDVPAAVAEDVPAAVAEDVAASVAEDVPAAVAEDVAAAVAEVVPAAVAEDVPAAVAEDVAAAVAEDVPAAVAEDVAVSVAEDVAVSVAEDVAAVVAEDVAAAVAEDVPAAVVEVVPAAVAEDVPAAVAEDVPAAVAEDVPAAVVEDVPAAVAEDVLAESAVTVAASSETAPSPAESVAEETVSPIESTYDEIAVQIPALVESEAPSPV